MNINCEEAQRQYNSYKALWLGSLVLIQGNFKQDLSQCFTTKIGHTQNSRGG